MMSGNSKSLYSVLRMEVQKVVYNSRSLAEESAMRAYCLVEVSTGKLRAQVVVCAGGLIEDAFLKSLSVGLYVMDDI